MRKTIACAAFLLFVSSISNLRDVAAQVQSDQRPGVSFEGFEGRNVSKVEVALAPGKDIELAKSLLVQKAGQPLSRAAIQQSVAQLQQHPEFRRVQVSIEPDQNGLRIVFLIQPVYVVGLVTFPGAVDKISYTRLLQALNFQVDAPFIAAELPDKEKALKQFLLQQGYFTAVVHATTETLDAQNLVNVSFACDLGKRTRIGAIRVSGVSPAESADILNTLHSLWARISATSLRSGQKYSKRRVDKSLDYARTHLAKNGRLATSIHAQTSYDSAGNRVGLELQVAPGPLVDVRVVGAHLWKRTMRKLLPMFQEGAIDQDLIEEGRRNLVSYFQTKSYFDATVTSKVENEGDHVTITYSVDRGIKHRVEHILFTNNNYFADGELQQRISIKKARFPFYRGKYSEVLLRKSSASLEALYRREGFASAKVTTNVTDDDPVVDVEFIIQEGEQNKVGAVQIVDANGESIQAPPGARRLPLTPGKPYSLYYVNQERDQILAAYLNHGYPDVTADVATQPSAQNANVFEITYKITSGRQVRIADVVLLGPQKTRPDFLDAVIHQNVRAGRPLGQNMLLRAENDLYSLGVFDWASVTSAEPGEDGDTQPVLVRVHESKRNSLDVGGGIEVIPRNGNLPVGTVAVPGIPNINLGSKFTVSQKSFVGPRISFQFSRHNLRGRAETASIATILSRLDQRLTFTYTDPDLHGSRWSSLFSVSGQRTTENPIFTAVIGQAAFQVETNLDRRKTQKIITRYSYGRTDLTNIVIPDLVLPEDQHVRLSSVYAEFVRDTRDNPMDAHRGQFQTLSFGITPTAFGSSADFVKFIGQAATYRPVRPWLVWANNFRFGVAPPFADSRVPLSERFFTGGPNTLRGFAINGAGPQRPVQACSNSADPSTCTLISVPVGGEMLAIFNSEARFPIPQKQNLSGVIFYDGGNVYNNINVRQFFSNYTNTVGVGIRYKTKIGPIRFDIAQRLTHIPGVKATQYFITLGQAF